MPVTRDEIVWAYRCIMGREPESEAAIEGAMSFDDLLALRRSMLGSVEFQLSLAKLGGTATTAPPGGSPSPSNGGFWDNI